MHVFVCVCVCVCVRVLYWIYSLCSAWRHWSHKVPGEPKRPFCVCVCVCASVCVQLSMCVCVLKKVTRCRHLRRAEERKTFPDPPPKNMRGGLWEKGQGGEKEGRVQTVYLIRALKECPLDKSHVMAPTIQWEFSQIYDIIRACIWGDEVMEHFLLTVNHEQNMFCAVNATCTLCVGGIGYCSCMMLFLHTVYE